jgi:hypothetical protein
MARVTCRCGESIEVAGAPERVVCPRCNTRIRIRRPNGQAAAGSGTAGGEGEGDGYIRFPCPCGRRLKMRATSPIEAGKCPDCGRVVPIPESARTRGGSPRGGADLETRTDELDKLDLARLDRWAARHGVEPEAARRPAARPAPVQAAPAAPIEPPSDFRREAGLRVCPQCHKPLHMQATVCRSCGASTPKR